MIIPAQTFAWKPNEPYPFAFISTSISFPSDIIGLDVGKYEQHILKLEIRNISTAVKQLKKNVMTINKNDLHDITEILLKVAFNAITLTPYPLSLMTYIVIG